MALPTPAVVPPDLQVGDPTNSILVLRGSLAGGQDLILRTGGVTADVNIPASGNLLSDAVPVLVLTVTTLYIGSNARFVALSNGVRLEVMDGGGNWIPQNAWTES